MEDKKDKKDEKKDKKGDADEDLRLEFLLNYLTKTLRMKMEKWMKMITTEEYSVSLFSFNYYFNTSVRKFFGNIKIIS